MLPIVYVGVVSGSTYFIGMPKPRRTLLLAAHKRHPIVTAPAQPLPDVWITIHSPSLLRLLKWAAGCSTDTMSETFIVPEGAVLQDKPPPGFTDSTPPLALVSMAADPARSV